MNTVRGKIVVICFVLHVLPITLSAADGFYIRDGVLMDAKGYPFIMRGVSVPFAWFNNDSYNALPVIAALKANTIRIVWTQNMTASRLDEVMKRCVELKMIPVPELHDVTGKDDAGSLNTCANIRWQAGRYLPRSSVVHLVPAVGLESYLMITGKRSWSNRHGVQGIDKGPCVMDPVHGDV